MLNIIIDVIGKNSLKLGLSTIISPGNLPNGNFEIHCQVNPTKTITTPIIIIIF